MSVLGHIPNSSIAGSHGRFIAVSRILHPGFQRQSHKQYILPSISHQLFSWSLSFWNLTGVLVCISLLVRGGEHCLNEYGNMDKH